MQITDPLEVAYLVMLLQRERTAPADKHQGLLDGVAERNTQVARMGYLLTKIWAVKGESVFETLSRYARREDGEAYVSNNSVRMIEPYALPEGWYLEGCMDLGRKQALLQHLTRVGISSHFVACADDFVAGKSVKEYLPTDDDAQEVMRKIREQSGHEV